MGNGEEGTGNGEELEMTLDYRDLEVWKQSMELCEKVYTLIRHFPSEERYALSDQLRRAVVSIPSNIAEGNGRNSRSEYAHFISIARGSLFETRTQLDLALRFKYVSEEDVPFAQIDSIGKMLYVMLQKLKG